MSWASDCFWFLHPCICNACVDVNLYVFSYLYKWFEVGQRPLRNPTMSALLLLPLEKLYHYHNSTAV